MGGASGNKSEPTHVGCYTAGRMLVLGGLAACLAIAVLPTRAQPAASNPPANEIRIVELQGTVEISPAGATTWVLTQTNQVLHPADRLRTGPNSRVALRWSNESVVSFNALTEIEVLPPHDREALSGLHLFKGILSFFHRDKPGRMRVMTSGAEAGIQGTEFVLEVDDNRSGQPTTLSVIDGQVQFTNSLGALVVTNGQQAVAELGHPPVRAPGFIANNILQWCFYYPAVLDLRDLPLTPQEEQALSDSLAAYRAGDLLTALARYPSFRQPTSDADIVYHAALLLAVGQVEQTEAALAALPVGSPTNRLQRLATSLRTLIAAVKRQPSPSTLDTRHSSLSTELLASSYYEQSRAQGEDSLSRALMLARQAATNSPEFGFAWERVAELEFSFGRTARALEALNTSLELSPRNAQALALKGFLLAAQNRTREAMGWFDQAIAVDSALGNAWLGRGLCKIRVGSGIFDSPFRFPQPALEDLLIAAALEPQRSLLRSYLGKAYADAGNDLRATHELNLARHLDPKDPTGWLYSALLKQQENRVNEAISDLEASQERNDNHSLFRSRLLLDEDRAVSSVNLASIYRDAGMNEVSLREAARAVTYDYANDSAHLFLSDSFNELRDPTRFNLRYETVWFNELLLANALSPVGGGRLSQHLSQQEYSQLFQADGLHLANSTLYRSDNQSVQELASQYGTFGGTSYALDLDYDYQRGVRPNNDLSSIEWYSTIKQQLTPQDTVMALVKYEDYHSGDNFQYYDPANARPNFRFDEYQHPIAVGAFHHEWSPGMHTLLLGGRLENEQQFSDLGAHQLLLYQDSQGNVFPDSEPFDVNYNSKLEIYTAELNQIFQWNRLTISAGARYQWGDFNTDVTLTNPPGLVPFLFPNSSDTTNVAADFERVTGYGYMTLEPVDRVWITGGFAYDDITYPLNFRHPPIASGEDHRSQLGPKAALVWQIAPQVTLRGMYAKSLGGVSLDESYRLEPTQLAGFPQTFRTLISESVVGSVAAPEYEIFGGALDLKFPTGTYAGVQAQQLNSHVSQTIGLFAITNATAPYHPVSTVENLDYRENAVIVTLNQLLGEGLVAGAGYKYDQVSLLDTFPNGLASSVPQAHLEDHSDLHQATGYLLLNHPSGFFARADATWYHQRNTGNASPGPGDDFAQENIYAGYRFLNRRVELLLGILNLSDQDYHLNPITVYMELPRERSYIVRLNFVF